MTEENNNHQPVKTMLHLAWIRKAGKYTFLFFLGVIFQNLLTNLGLLDFTTNKSNKFASNVDANHQFHNHWADLEEMREMHMSDNSNLQQYVVEDISYRQRFQKGKV